MHTEQVEECQIEIVNGREEIRNLGEYEHSSMQLALAMLLRLDDKVRGTRTLIEQTVQINPDTRRVPDVAVFLRTTPIEPVFTNAPIAVFEVLSREDRVQRYNERIADYMRFGVENIYVIDPHTKTAWDVSNGCWIRTYRLRIHGGHEIILSTLIEALKEQEA